MKNLKLRKEVKLLLLIIGIIVFIVLYNESINNDIEECIASGVDSNICYELAR